MSSPSAFWCECAPPIYYIISPNLHTDIVKLCASLFLWQIFNSEIRTENAQTRKTHELRGTGKTQRATNNHRFSRPPRQLKKTIQHPWHNLQNKFRDVVLYFCLQLTTMWLIHTVGFRGVSIFGTLPSRKEIQRDKLTVEIRSVRAHYWIQWGCPLLCQAGQNSRSHFGREGSGKTKELRKSRRRINIETKILEHQKPISPVLHVLKVLKTRVDNCLLRTMAEKLVSRSEEFPTERAVNRVDDIFKWL